MVDCHLAAAKLAALADRIRRHCPPTVDALRADRDALGLVSFNLVLAVQSSAGLAAHLIADEGWPAAVDLASGFNRLRDEGVISKARAESLCKAVGLRSVVAHGCAGINAAMVHAAAASGVDDLEAFAKQVAQWISAQPADP